MKKKHILFSTIISMGMMVSSCSDYLSVEGKLGENTRVWKIYLKIKNGRNRFGDCVRLADME